METLLEAIKQLEEKQIKAKANRKSANYQVRNQANSEVYFNRCNLFALNTAWYIVKHNVDTKDYINSVLSKYKGIRVGMDMAIPHGAIIEYILQTR